jgi:serine/threonine-protein kinase PpkA
MSPEQARGQPVDSRSDLYSLGVVFFEMLTGALPYQGEDAVTIALKHISAPIPKLPVQYQIYQKLLDKFLAKDPSQRFQSGHEVSVAIDQLDAASRTPYITDSVPDNLSVTALFRALVAATTHAIKWRWNKLINLRWNKENGFYAKKISNDSVFGSEVAPNLFATRIQQQTHINPQLFLQNRNLTKILAGVVLSIFLWCVLSVVTHAYFAQQALKLPSILNKATKATANIFITTKSQPPAKIAQATQTTSVAPKALVSASAQSSAAASFGASSTQSSLALSRQSSSSAAPTYALTIKTTPSDARIRLLSISDKYKDGIPLASGRYRIEISKTGYKTKTESIDIKNEPLNIAFELEAIPDISNPTRAAIPNIVYGGKNAPSLIRIPAGSFIMGDDSSAHTAPTHKVTLNKAFAITKYEITFAEYDFFAQSTNKPLPGDNGWGREDRPVIHVSWEDANAYARWLSKTTGKKFRLPTEAEWEYVARAGSAARYWWGDSELDAKGKANCRRGCSSSFSGLFGSKTAPVGSYLPNPFGVYDTAGNVSEWVQDCYEENYTEAKANGSAYEHKQCQGRVVRGGSTKDSAQRLSSSARDNIPSGYLNETLGFRLVMELN